MPKPNDYKMKKKKITEFQKQLGNEEVDHFEKNMFDESFQGGKTEADALIERYSKKTKLSDEEKEILRNNVPEAPSFPLLKREQYAGNGCWKRKKYRDKVRDYYKKRKKYYTTSDKRKNKDNKIEETESKGQLYARTRKEIEDRISNENDQLIVDNQEKTTDIKAVDIPVHNEPEADEINEAAIAISHPEIEEDADAMDKAYKSLRENEQFIENETKIGESMCRKTRNNTPKFGMALSVYSGPYYSRINSSLRNNQRYLFDTEHLANGIKNNPLNRDLLCRRGVKDVNTLAHMMGLENASNMSEEEIKEVFNQRFESGDDLIISDKSFMSTSLPFAKDNFGAGDGFHIGIEFMILMKKGTPAMNISSMSVKKSEQEVLVAPGTKFRVIKAELDGNADILHGTEKSWKIWLVSVPSDEDNADLS